MGGRHGSKLKDTDDGADTVNVAAPTRSGAGASGKGSGSSVPQPATPQSQASQGLLAAVSDNMIATPKTRAQLSGHSVEVDRDDEALEVVTAPAAAASAAGDALQGADGDSEEEATAVVEQVTEDAQGAEEDFAQATAADVPAPASASAAATGADADADVEELAAEPQEAAEQLNGSDSKGTDHSEAVREAAPVTVTATGAGAGAGSGPGAGAVAGAGSGSGSSKTGSGKSLASGGSTGSMSRRASSSRRRFHRKWAGHMHSKYNREHNAPTEPHNDTTAAATKEPALAAASAAAAEATATE